MTKKKVSWLLLVVILLAWGYQKRNSNESDATSKAIFDRKLTEQSLAKFKADTNALTHGMYQSSVCDFKKKLEPINQVLGNISKRKAIPPDLLPEVKTLNDTAKFMAMDETIFLPDDGLNPEELKIKNSMKKFATELNLKSAELEQGIISGNNSYFINLNQKVESLVQPACDLYALSNPDKIISPSPSPRSTQSRAPGSIDFEIDQIGKQVAFDSICKLKSSASTLANDVANAQSNVAFKVALLETSKTSIYDLDYATYTFAGKLLYTPSPNELQWAGPLEALKLDLEKSRYSYWANNSKSALISMNVIVSKMKAFGKTGCDEVVKLKKS